MVCRMPIDTDSPVPTRRRVRRAPMPNLDPEELELILFREERIRARQEALNEDNIAVQFALAGSPVRRQERREQHTDRNDQIIRGIMFFWLYAIIGFLIFIAPLMMIF